MTRRNIKRPRRVSRTVRRPKRTERLIPRWFPIAVALCLTTLVCLTINFRAYTDLRREAAENGELNEKIRQKISENLLRQEEIHYLRNDPATIEREVRKLGLVRPEEKVSKPAK